MSGTETKSTGPTTTGAVKTEGPNRRDMLKGAALAGVGAAVAVPLAVTGAEAAEGAAEQIKGRYRETEHIKRYYYLNRL